MARIAGINIPDQKQIATALTYIYGIGDSLSKKILKNAQVEATLRVKDLKPEQVNRLKEIIEKNYKIEGELKREKMMNIKRLRDIGTWRGLRHAKGLPVRGQHTKTNTRSIRGNVRKTVGSGKKAALETT